MDASATTGPSLGALLARFRAGDTDALGAIFDAAAPGLFRTALHLAPDAAAAEDALQETFLAFLDAVREGAAIREVGPWLAGTLRNKVLRGRRDARRVPDPLMLPPPTAAGDPADAAAHAEEVERIRRALDELPETYRETAILRWRYGMEPAAIADARGVAPGTVRSLLSRAAEQLRERLGSLALGVLPLPVTRGLGAIRGRLLHAARIAAPATSVAASSAVGGFVMAKKAVVGLAVLLLLLLGGKFAVERFASSRDPADDARLSGESAASSSPAATGHPRTRATPESATTAAEGSAPATLTPRPAFPKPEPSGALVVRAVWEDNGRPAAGLWVRVHAWDGPDPFLFMFRDRTGDDGVATFPAVFCGNAGIYAESGSENAVVEAGARREVELRVPRGIRVEGTVVDKDGKLVADAAIHENGCEVAKTGADGAFVLELVEDGARLGARAPGYAPSGRSYVIAKSGTTVRLKMVLPGAGGAVAGRVLDPEGHPLAGAAVRVLPENWIRHIVLEDGSTTQPQDAFVLATDDTGRFRIDGVEPGKTIVRARAPGLALGEATVDVFAGATAEIELRLANGASIAGVVKDAGGAPAKGAFVGVGTYGDFRSSQTYANAEGRYRLDGLKAGNVEIRAAGPDDRGKTSAVVPVAAGGEGRWDAVLTEGNVLRGRVLDEAGRPRAKCSVTAFADLGGAPFGTQQGVATTDSEGRFSLSNTQAGVVRVLVTMSSPDGWAPYPSAIREDVAVGGADVDITVPDRDLPTAFIVGEVRGPDGEPVENASVYIRHPVVNFVPYLHTDASGKFRGGPLPPATYEIEFEAKGLPHLRLGARKVDPGAQVDVGTIRLATGGSLEVRAKCEGGAPLPNWWGQVLAEDGASAAYLAVDKDLARVAALLPGRYRVRAEAMTGKKSFFAEVAVEIRANERTSVDVVLAPASLRSFRAVRADGTAPREKVRLVVRSQDGLFRDSPFEGSMSFVLPPGSFTVEASTASGARATARFDVAAGDEPKDPVVLTLR